MAEAGGPPVHLDPSELGTKEYWDNYYQNDLDNDEDEDAAPENPSELESWFDDVDAPAKTLEFLTSKSFPLSATNRKRQGNLPCVLDLGTGNGSALFSLRMEGGYQGPMVGVDYSQQSVNLARRLWKQYSAFEGRNEVSYHPNPQADTSTEITFHVVDLIHGNPSTEVWWPRDAGGFDLVLDKGTFDAISLSSETTADENGRRVRICELYPMKVASMVAPGGFLLVTSCNWTEDEVVKWFMAQNGTGTQLELYDTIKYPVYEFGGQKGQGVASVCFRRR